MADLKNIPWQTSQSPGAAYIAVTASATPFASGPCRGIYIGSAGNITVTDRIGVSTQFVSLAVGVIHPIQATALTAATAGSIVIVY